MDRGVPIDRSAAPLLPSRLINGAAHARRHLKPDFLSRHARSVCAGSADLAVLVLVLVGAGFRFPLFP
jgi:hypothetical protein